MRAVYPGSFDPVTFGHLDIIRRSSALADELIVGVLINRAKTPLFSSEERVKMLVDATKELLTNVLKYKPFLIKPNNFELSEIVGKKLTTDEEIYDAAIMLQKEGAKNVLISMAGDGAMLVDENQKKYRIAVPKGEVKNSVGAGDSMVAGFIAGYLQSNNYEIALKMGTAAGSATAFSLGLANKDDIYNLFNNL